MKGWLLSSVMLLLAACGGKSGDGGIQNEGVAAANAAIVQANAVAEAETSPKETVDPIARTEKTAIPGTRAIPDENPSSPRPATGYRAIGTEPFWAVTVKGSTATLERPDKAAERFPVSRNDDRRAIRYIGEGFSMTVTEGPCSDGMSDSIWSDQVAIAFGEGTLKGCGGARIDP